MSDAANEFLIHGTAHTKVEQSYGFRVPGYLIVGPRMACTRLAELDALASADLFACLARAESLVTELLQPERVYVARFGEENPQVHFHVFPRTARIEHAYLADVPDGKPYSGARIVDWTWRHHASLGHTDDEVRDFVRRAREWWGTPSPQLERIDHVQLAMPAGQEEQARQFYCGLLGLTEVPKPASLAARGGAWFEHGDLHVHLGVDPEFRGAKKAHPAFQVTGLASFSARLRQAGAPVTEDDLLPGFARLFVHDPFGNRIELLEPLDERDSPREQ